MAHNVEEIALIIKVGTTLMLTLALGVIVMVVYLHGKLIKAQLK